MLIIDFEKNCSSLLDSL